MLENDDYLPEDVDDREEEMKDENSDMSDSSKIEKYSTEIYEYLPEEMEVLEDRNYSSIFEATGNEGNDLQNFMSDTDYESSFSEKKHI